jgi:uncharacterized protein (DUF488 family)
MRTEEFAQAVKFPMRETTAVMCSEGPWRKCHRRLLSDWFTLLGDTEILHIGHDGSVEKHRSEDNARQQDGKILYDSGELSLF